MEKDQISDFDCKCDDFCCRDFTSIDHGVEIHGPDGKYMGIDLEKTTHSCNRKDKKRK